MVLRGRCLEGKGIKVVVIDGKEFLLPKVYERPNGKR
jgi:hypothetical protein